MGSKTGSLHIARNHMFKQHSEIGQVLLVMLGIFPQNVK